VRDWVVLLIKPRQEQLARDNVLNQGAEFYYPRAYIRSEKTRKVAVASLFPGYAFARPASSAWTFLRSTNGVRDVLMAGGERPAVVRDAEIAKLQRREGADGIISLEVTQFTPGEHVRVEAGPFQDFDAIVDNTVARDRVCVLLSVLGRMTRVEVDVGNISRG